MNKSVPTEVVRYVCVPSRSGVIGIGPQIGIIVPAGQVQAYLNLRSYWEFDAHDRPSGFNVWLTLSLSPSAPMNPRSVMVTKWASGNLHCRQMSGKRRPVDLQCTQGRTAAGSRLPRGTGTEARFQHHLEAFV